MKKLTKLLLVITVAFMLSTSCSKKVDVLSTPVPAAVNNNNSFKAAVYTLLFQDDFNGSSVNTSDWDIYDGTGHAGNGLRKPSAFTVSGGILSCTASMVGGILTSGGMAHKLNRTYGRYEARVLCQNDPSGIMSGVILTWPQSEVWPQDGENDFYETGTGQRTSTSGWNTYIHYGTVGSDQDYYHHSGDARAWHTVAMDWTASSIQLFDDGVLKWTDSNTDHIPDVNHHLCIQYDAFGSSVSASSSLQVDWVKISSISNNGTTVDNTASSFVYTGGTWATANDAGHYGGSEKEIGTLGGTVVYSFTGTSAQIFSYFGPWSGKVDVYVDNVWKVTVDEYNSSNSYQHLIYDTGTLSSGNHSIKMYALGTKNASSGGYTIGCDKAIYY